MVHAIMRSNLPASEKTVMRVFDDVSTVSGAAFETTAAAIRLALYYMYTNPAILDRLRAELSAKATQMTDESDH